MDLSAPQSGNFGPEFRFSDWFVWATKQKFTGGVLIHPPAGDCAIMWRHGAPCRVRGPGVKEDFLGELLVAFGSCTKADVDEALGLQGGDADRPLLGALLKAQGVIDQVKLKAALSVQTIRRLSRLFVTAGGAWQSAPGENESLYRIGVPVDATAVLVKGLKWHAPDGELADVAESLSQWAVKLRGADTIAATVFTDEDDKTLLQLLRFPRTIASLEAHSGNRGQVRALVRTLILLELIEPVPRGQAIPIGKTRDVASPMATGEFPVLPPELAAKAGLVSGPPPSSGSGFDAVRTGGFGRIRTPEGSGGFEGELTPSLPQSGSYPGVVEGVRTPTLPTADGFDGVKSGAFEGVRTPGLPGAGFDGVYTPGPGTGGFERVRTPLVKLDDAPSSSSVQRPVARRASGISRRPSTLGVPSPVKRPRSSGAVPVPVRSETASRKDVPAEQRELATELVAMHKKIGGSAFELLGIESSASDLQITQARRKRAKRFSPDLLMSQLPDDLLEKARELMAAINQAAEMLSDPELRAEYVELEKAVKESESPPPPPEKKKKPKRAKASSVVEESPMPRASRSRSRVGGLDNFEERESARREAKVRFKMGRVLLHKRQCGEARAHFKFCMDADQANASYAAHYGWAYFNDPHIDRPTAIEKAYSLISAAAVNGKRDAEIQTFLGRVLKEKGDVQDAITAFQTALRADPAFTPAARELKSLGGEVPHHAAPLPEDEAEDTGKLGGRIGKMFRR